MRILILGGTGEATMLAKTAVAQLPQLTVQLSLAGRTQNPQTMASVATRIGGFGGVEGLVDYLRERQVGLVIDATHPFAGKISRNAALAAEQLGIPRLMLVRSPWQSMVGDRWSVVPDLKAAAAAVEQGEGRRVFLTIGRQEVGVFAGLAERWFLMRMIEPAEGAVPEGVVLLDRGPYYLDSELAILKRHAIDLVVSKNSGGPATYAKIEAARQLGLGVVMIDRPAIPESETVETVAGAIDWLRSRV
ncbi:MAG: cobalt-precorrin-6A reductase [Alkalinema sp. RU_4_3]|nr:cobalt-precorrin-6A reductase [Alkalinema sp. RU_4_3]